MTNVIRNFNQDTSNEVKIVETIEKKSTGLVYDMENNTFSDPAKGEVFIRIKDKRVKLEKKVKRIGDVGEYTYFDFLCMVNFKNNATSMLNYVIHDHYGEEIPFICVGTDYYKVITSTDRYGVKRTKLKLWKLSEIKPFHGKDVIYKIPKYDDFCLEPNNIDYEPVINNMYNQHSEFSHVPDLYASHTKWTTILMKHIFGEQYDQGMIYLQCLYMYPKQSLPILVLTSEERSTGKSTFVEYLNLLFGENMVIVNPEDIGSSFNSSYSDKNIIAIEESRFDSVQATEKLKNLATQKKILVNAKHQQPYSLPFFGKLIITSNDEHKFSKVDEREIRYWVRKIPTLEGKVQNHNILNDLLEEIPAFLAQLIAMPAPDFSKSRMVFTENDIKTEALDTVKKESRTQLEKDVVEILTDIFHQDETLEEVYFIPKDFKDRYFKNDSRISISYLRNVFDTKFKFNKTDKLIRYEILDDAMNSLPGGKKKSGIPYVVKREELGILKYEIEEQEERDALPF